MAGNTIGRMFRVTTYGESHGIAAGGVIDGCPAGLALDIPSILRDLSRRRASASSYSTTRIEEDEPEFLSGLFEGITTGAPIAFIVHNKNQRPSEYQQLRGVFRPGHGDYAWHKKYGHHDHRGGGRYSARETVSRVVAGAIAKQLIVHSGITIQSWVAAIGKTSIEGYGPWLATDIERSAVGCPDEQATRAILLEIGEAAAKGDTLGGIVGATVTGVPAGLGEPVFDKIEAELAKAMMSIPSVKAFEIGEGFRASAMPGSHHNDIFTLDSENRITTRTNYGGGTLGGISSGTPLNFRVGFKPVSSVKIPQETLTQSGEPATVDLSGGRHDVCVVPRALPVVEGMAAIVLADLMLRNRCARR